MDAVKISKRQTRLNKYGELTARERVWLKYPEAVCEKTASQFYAVFDNKDHANEMLGSGKRPHLAWLAAKNAIGAGIYA
jgi:hypothetical protein